MAAGRQELNAAIRALPERLPAGGPPTVVVDVDAAFPNEALGADERAAIWEPDGLHLTPVGCAVQQELLPMNY